MNLEQSLKSGLLRNKDWKDGCLKDYKINNVIDDYEIETSDDLWKFVIDTLGKGD